MSLLGHVSKIVSILLSKLGCHIIVLLWLPIFNSVVITSLHHTPDWTSTMGLGVGLYLMPMSGSAPIKDALVVSQSSSRQHWILHHCEGENRFCHHSGTNLQPRHCHFDLHYQWFLVDQPSLYSILAPPGYQEWLPWVSTMAVFLTQ